LSRATVALEFIDAIRQKTNAKVLFFGHDIQYRRMQGEFAISRDPRLQEEIRYIEPLERRMWAESDVIYYPSRDECDFVRTILPAKAVRVVPQFLYSTDHIGRMRERVLASGIPATHRLLFVGGFRHRPNVDAMLWFAQDVWPRVISEVPSCKLCIAGSRPPQEIRALAGPSVTVTGHVTDDELNDLYASTQIVIAPLRFGGGLKGKIMEALLQGRPVVTTSSGAQGLPGLREVVNVCDTAQEFAGSIVNILRHPTPYVERVINGLDFVQAVASETAARKVFALDIPEFRTAGMGARRL
jgi:glycosyltransferase involved in cell wall biosynthesis